MAVEQSIWLNTNTVAVVNEDYVTIRQTNVIDYQDTEVYVTHEDMKKLMSGYQKKESFV